MRVLLAAQAFPNRQQPWLHTSIRSVIAQGVEVILTGVRGPADDWVRSDEDLQTVSFIEVSDTARAAALIGIRSMLGFGSQEAATAWRGLPVVLRAGYRSTNRVRSMMRLDLAQLAGIRDIDLIHAHSLWRALQFVRIKSPESPPLLVTFHGLHPDGIATLTQEHWTQLASGVDGWTANTKFSAAQLEGFGIDAGRIHVMPQGTRLDQFPYRPRPHPGHGEVSVLTVSRLAPEKGLLAAIEAISILRSEGVPIRYTIFGSGPARGSTAALVDRLGLMDCVHLAGEIAHSSLPDEYARAHLFLLPTLARPMHLWNETQGVVLQEAQASGCVVVATTAGGIPECVDDETRSRLVAPGDPRAIADRIVDILRAASTWPEIQRRGRQWVEDHFDVRHSGPRLVELYRQIVSLKRPSGTNRSSVAGQV